MFTKNRFQKLAGILNEQTDFVDEPSLDVEGLNKALRGIRYSKDPMSKIESILENFGVQLAEEPGHNVNLRQPYGETTLSLMSLDGDPTELLPYELHLEWEEGMVVARVSI